MLIQSIVNKRYSKLLLVSQCCGPVQFSSVQSLSHAWLFVPHELQQARPPFPSPTPRVYSKSCPLSQWCHPAISFSVFPFSSCTQCLSASGTSPSESTLRMRWPRYWSFNLSICPSNEHPRLISFSMDWLYLLAVQGTLKSLLQHHSSKAWIQQCSAFFTFQLSHPYMTTGKTIALTRWNFVGNVMSLLFIMLSRLVITFLSSSKLLLISWLQSPSAQILEPPKIKSAIISTVSPSPSISHKVMELDAMILLSRCWALIIFFTLLFQFHQENF